RLGVDQVTGAGQDELLRRVAATVGELDRRAIVARAPRHVHAQAVDPDGPVARERPILRVEAVAVRHLQALPVDPVEAGYVDAQLLPADDPAGIRRTSGGRRGWGGSRRGSLTGSASANRTGTGSGARAATVVGADARVAAGQGRR